MLRLWVPEIEISSGQAMRRRRGSWGSFSRFDAIWYARARVYQMMSKRFEEVAAAPMPLCGELVFVDQPAE